MTFYSGMWNAQVIFSSIHADYGIDFLSGTFRTRFHYMLAWLALILAIVSYTDVKYDLPTVCDDNFGCLLGKHVLDWLITLLIFV